MAHGPWVHVWPSLINVVDPLYVPLMYANATQAHRKPPAIAIPDVNWTDNMIRQVVEQIERNENRVVLLGKRKTGDVHALAMGLIHSRKRPATVAVYQRIGAAVLHTYHAINAVATGDRVKRKYKHLFKKYKTHARRLRTTGESVKTSNGAEDDDESDEYFDCYVPASGPDATTTVVVQSIWGI
ncbi:hypothetical protein BU15DRAFT_62835 [Melanogaster broomeanus]|nr:hypothetical protein BU15DRAFT_62835 [Melanogaster broomeanus]